MRLNYAAAVFLLLLAGVGHAACIDPLIPYNRCTEACPSAVDKPIAASNCVNACLAQYKDDTEAYYKCQQEERDEAEKKRLEEENKLRGIEEAKVLTVSTVEGMIWLTNPEGLASNLARAELPDMKSGSILRSDPGSTAVVVIKEGSRLQLGPDSQFTYVDGEPIIEGELEKMKYIFYVSKGRVRYESDDPTVQYEVHTSQGTVVNRQTDFIVEVEQGTEITSVYLYEGMLDVNTTYGEWLVLKAGDRLYLSSEGVAELSNLSMEDWGGLVNSTETGADFTPSWKMQAAEAGQTEQETVAEPEKTGIARYIMIAVAITLIIILVAVVSRRKKR